MSWISQLSNATEVFSLFPDCDLALTNLQLLRFEYSPGNMLAIDFESAQLPRNLPTRWTERRLRAIELRFVLGTSSLFVEIPDEVDDMPPASVSFEGEAFTVQADRTDVKILLKARVFTTTLKILPLTIPAPHSAA